ncbi:hypothetical protein ACWCOT_23115 [Nonomuraea bangladeshensis]
MKPHSVMLAQINRAARTVAQASSGAAVTSTIRAVDRQKSTPKAAVYVAWDMHGRCRYVGSVRRPGSRTAVRDRVREHFAKYPDRRANWYALTILPLRDDLDIDQVRMCEGWVAYMLTPMEGAAHPVIAPDYPLVA